MTTTYSDAGVQFADGTVQAVSAGTAYRPSNLLGVVSQVAGVPTGAVIQRGSNANGEFVRFADGTQICILVDLSEAATADIGVTSTVAFPATFGGGTVSIHTSIVSVSATNTYYHSISGTTITATNFLLTRRFSVTQTYSLRTFAIGRWF